MAKGTPRPDLNVTTPVHWGTDGWMLWDYDTTPVGSGFLIRNAPPTLNPTQHRLEILYWQQDRDQDETQFVLDAKTGNIGIGAINPTDKLTICGGGLSFQQAGQTIPEMGMDYDAASQSLRIKSRTETGLDKVVLTITKNGEITATAVRANSLTANGADKSLTIASTGTGALLLNPAGGNVGIGKPPSVTGLDVNGTVKANGFEGSGANITGINAANITGGLLATDRVPSLTNLNGDLPIATRTTGDLPIARTSGDLPITRTTGVLPAARVDGVFSQWTTSGSAIHYNGNVGIGTQGEGDGKLEIRGGSKDAIVKFGGKNGDVNHLSSLLSMFFDSVGGEYYFRKLEDFGDLGKFTDLMSIRSDGLHVNQNLQADGGISCSGKINNPMWQVSQPIANVLGPLPVQGTFATGGGTLLLLVSGSGRLNDGIGLLGMEIWIDTIKRGEAKVCSNTQYAHCAFVSTPLVVKGLTRDTYQIRLVPLTPIPYSTITDGNDFFNVTILEFPF